THHLDTTSHSFSGYGALAFLPIRVNGGVTLGGVLVLYDGIHPFSAAERQLHQLVTDFGGVALQRSRLIAAAQRRADREALLLSVNERLQRSLDPEAILRTAVTELGNALDAKSVTIEIASAPGADATLGVEPTPGDKTDDELPAHDMTDVGGADNEGGSGL
ncbi:MAG: GAF domain-containing protein, partial [Anaerolineae bacterium]|nr:GAF domain-containing protein [Anaerolineae bacterium]